MNVSGKAWGMTSHIMDVAGISLHYIEVDAGGYCSVHSHSHKCNAFYVLDGELIVNAHRGGLVDVTRLGPGDLLEVESGVVHQFKSESGCRALEVYYAMPLRSDDIERKSIGGKSR